MSRMIFRASVLAAGFLWLHSTTSVVTAQNADALLNKLVEKGILTQKEATDLKAESNKDFTKAYQAKTGAPDWVKSLRIGGDFRARYDLAHSDNSAFLDRHRFRYRIRAGAVANLMDDVEVGFRLTSGEPQAAFGGDPISGNSSFQDNGSKKFVWVDLAYGRWSPTLSDTMRNSLALGKLENPFTVSDLLFDSDYTPEGIGNQFTFTPSDTHTFRLNLGAFALDEIGASSADPFFFGAQVRWDAKWTKKFETSLGVMAYTLDNDQSLTNGSVPNINVGNTRVGPPGALSHHFNPIYADISLGYTFDSIGALYPGAFPVRIVADVIHNPAASTRNSGFSGGFVVGKSGKKGSWDFSWRYRFVEADSTFEEFIESDFGAFYPTPPATFGAAGFRAGTNLRGHAVKANYSITPSLTLGLSYILSELVQDDPFVGPGADGDTTSHRLLLDAIWKF